MRATRRLPPRAVAVAVFKNLRTVFGARERPPTSRPRAAPNPAHCAAPAAVCACNPTRIWSSCRRSSLNSADSEGIALRARGQLRKVPWGARSNVARASPRVAPPQNPKRRRRAAAVGAHLQTCGQTTISLVASRSELFARVRASMRTHPPRNPLGTHGAPARNTQTSERH